MTPDQLTLWQTLHMDDPREPGITEHFAIESYLVACNFDGIPEPSAEAITSTFPGPAG